MARTGAISVDCPECGEEIVIPVSTQTETDGEQMILVIHPDRQPVVEHFVKCQADDDQHVE